MGGEAGTPRLTDEASSRFVVTSNRGFAAYAQDELRALIHGAKFEELARSEVYVLHSPFSREHTIRFVRQKEPIFVRHIHPVDETVPLSEGGDADVRNRIVSAVERLFVPESAAKVAVQVRRTDGKETEPVMTGLRESISEALERRFGVETVVKHADAVVSVYIAPLVAYIGISAPEDNISDWPGGAIRFRKEDDQVSRAKFKLLEAEYVFGIDLTRYRKALDIGAAPGGWTSLLLERGAEVTAVDPADLHPSLLRHPRLTYLKRNAGDVAFKPEAYDLLVCDMSWSPRQMTKLIVPLLSALMPGGAAIITLKLMHGKPFQTVKDTVRAMQPALELRKAKQLFHNRDELTIFLEKKI